MATRTALLNGNVINRDTDFSKYIEAVSEPGVIEGLAVSSTSVAIGKAFIKCERTNGDTIYAVVYNNSEQTISGNGDVYIEIPQELIDNGELAPEDGSDIAEIKVGTMPSKNALKLATKNGSTITDARNIIKKVGELNALIQQSNTDIEDLDERVETLEEKGAIDHLEESGHIGELYTINDKLFRQNTPTLENASIDCNIGDVAANTQIHIQRMGSGVASNTLKLKIKSVGSPTTGLVVEVRKGVQVEVSSTEAYWYGNQVVATGSIAYGSITNTYAEFTVTLNDEFGETEGEKLDVVIYQTGGIVNASNYYCVACDSTQYSEAFSYVSVNGSTRTRSKLMPYCVSDSFLQSLLVKVGNNMTLSFTKSFEVATTTDNTYQELILTNETDDLTVTPSDIPITMTASGSNTRYMKVNYWIDSTIYRGGASSSNYDVKGSKSSGTVSGNINVGDIALTRGQALYIGFTATGGGGTGTIGPFSISYTISLSKKRDRAGIPLSVKGIGNFQTTTIFGVVNDEFRVGEEETSITTGNIAPGNFVGYIQIGKYKIPYYL